MKVSPDDEHEGGCHKLINNTVKTVVYNQPEWFL